MRYCNQCGKELKDSDKFCDECGAKVNTVQDTNRLFEKQTSPSELSDKEKNKYYSQNAPKQKSGCSTALIVTIIVFSCIFLAFALPQFIRGFKDAANSDNEYSSREPRTTISEPDYKSKCRSVSYEEIARDIDGLKGEYFAFTGQVIQVSGDTYRMDVTKGEFDIYTDTIMFTYKAENARILEDDIITIWGVSKGLITYEAIFGNEVTVPNIKAKYVEILPQN